MSMYSVSFDNVAATASQDLFELNTSSTKSTIIHSIYVGQSTDFGDAQSELMRWRINTGHSTSGSGGSTFTPAILDGGSAAGATCKINNTTIASSGTELVRHADCFNVMGGIIYRPTPEERIKVPVSTRLCVRLLSTPADSITLSGTMIFEEVG